MPTSLWTHADREAREAIAAFKARTKSDATPSLSNCVAETLRLMGRFANPAERAAALRHYLESATGRSA